MEIPSDYLKISFTGSDKYRSHVFKNDSNEIIIAFWMPMDAIDHYDGERTDLIIESKINGEAQCLDILGGISQKLAVFRNHVKTIIPGLVIYDYPNIIKFTKSNGES